jgi:hypothetical protein
MQSEYENFPDLQRGLRRYQALLDMRDLMVRQYSLPELFHERAQRLQKVTDFQLLNFSLHDPEPNLMRLHLWAGERAPEIPDEVPVGESASGGVGTEAARGVPAVFGQVKLSTSSRDGKMLILKMAGPGEMLGLNAVISGTEYDLTAETAVPCHVNFVPREQLLALLEKHGEAGLRSAQALSREFQSAYPGYS